MVFNQKVLDFYLENYHTLAPLRLHRLFVTRAKQIDPTFRRFCALWGILIVDPTVYAPPIAQVILRGISEATAGTATPPFWLKPAQLARLERQAAELTGKLWRSLDTLVGTEPDLPGRLVLYRNQFPAARVTRQWVSEQQDLAREVRRLRFQFSHWQSRQRDAGGA